MAVETWTHAADPARTAVVETARDKAWAETHGFLPPAPAEKPEAEKPKRTRTRTR